MTLVSATFLINPGDTAAFEAAAADMVRLTNQEPGCLRYAVHQNPNQPGQYLFFEEWESRPHLEAHFNTEHFLKFKALTPALSQEPAKVRVYEVQTFEDL
ncbi:MAG: hypothetical protein BGO01_16105 [Armatimonadetes bacterium 55-13]|nr:antibiotic biosynthesis monooxygenase [Armatimonadota bacterium]ODU53929.1 MAG: hypothetical protein ABT09_00760 [bacterium SCN 57-13]OJU65382.1 MAG: hypothetical protein BGO01_16105 [Armatimonadetes bacterium 55-13]